MTKENKDTKKDTEQEKDDVKTCETEDEAARGEDKTGEYAEMLMRVTAEYDNFRKRTAREKETIYNDAVFDTVLLFLPVLDNLERSAEAMPQGEDFAKGILLILRQMREVLAALGVEPIKALGEEFDPCMHDAISHVVDPEAAEATVVCEFQKGYMMGDKVLRHSVVKVAN